MKVTGLHGPKRFASEPLERVQMGTSEWWEATPMTYDWRGDAHFAPLSREWFHDQDARSAAVHAHFATDIVPFDRLIPYRSLAGKEVLEIGVGCGFHAELLARAGAAVTGIDLTGSAIESTRRRFGLEALPGDFERWDAEQPRADFCRRFDFIWSWGAIHHSSRTGRIVRNVHEWLTEDGAFSGMVYHRASTSAAVALARDWLIHGNLFRHSVDEALWRGSDGYMARFYPAELWRDLLLAFFEEATVSVTGSEADAVPLPRALRRRIAPHVPSQRRDRVLARFGSFVTFHASRPLRSSGRGEEA